MSTEPYLLTPGPLTTSLRTKQSMLRDWGSWDADFNSITGRVRERLLQIGHGSGTHVALVHCETSTGILNPLEEVAQVVSRHDRGLIVDAMSSFGALEIDARTSPFDAVVAASGKCLEGPPGMGFVIVRREALERCEGNCH